MQATETEGLQWIHPYCNVSARWRGDRRSNIYELTVLTGTYDPFHGTVQPFNGDHALALLHDCGLIISRRGLPENRFQLLDLNTDLYALRTRWDQQVVPPQVHSDAPRRPSQLGSQFDPDTHTRIFINTGPANHYFFGIIPTLTGLSPSSGNALLIGTGPGFSHADFPFSEDAEAQTVSISAVRSLRMCGAHAPRVRRPDDDLWDALLPEYQTVVIRYFPRTDEGRDREEVVSRCLDCRDELISTSFRILQNHMEDYLSQQGPESDDYLACCDQRLSLLPVLEEPPVLLHMEEYTADDE